MELAGIIIIALSLSFVSFSVALSSSIYRCIEWDETFRIAFVFGLVHALMLGMGWLIGHAVNGWMRDMSFPVAILILFYIGIRMLLESRKINPEHRIIQTGDLKWLAGFAFLISINTFLTGISLGMLTNLILHSMIALGGIIFVLILSGIRLGKVGSLRSGHWAETAGGISLAVISVIVLLQYVKLI